MSVTDLQSAQDVLERSVASGNVAGAVALVGLGDEGRVLTAGGQTRGAAVPMRRDTTFRISSMTKAVTSAAAMLLIEEGRIRLDEPVDRLLPELANRRVLKRIDAPLDDTVPARRPLTVEDVLSFLLGLGVVLAPPGTYPIQRAIAEMELMGFGPPDPSVPYDSDEWMRRLSTLPLMAQPGEEWLYTAGSNVLGVLIARASGRSLPEFFQERIFDPLGMRDTAFFVPPEKRDRLAAGYRIAAGRVELYDDPAASRWGVPPAFPAGDAGLVSTVDDFFVFSRMLMNRGGLLSAASIDAMTENHLTEPQRAGGRIILGPDRGWGYGMSVVVSDTPEGIPAGSFGWNGGLGTTWVCDPRSRRTAILMTQTMFSSPDPPEIHKEFWHAVFG